MFTNYWHEHRRCSRSWFRRLTGNDDSGPLFSQFLARATVGTSLYVWLRQLLSAFFFVTSNPRLRCERRRTASYDVARLLLMVPIDPWRNSTPDFGAVAFCMTNIDDFRTPLTSTCLTIPSTYSSQKGSLRWTSSKRTIMELI